MNRRAKCKQRRIASIITIFIALALLSGVGIFLLSNKDSRNVEIIDNERTISTESNIDKEDDYAAYEGLWTLDGKPLNDSGVELHIEISNGTKLTGYMFQQSSTFDRFAEIEKISGSIINNECIYSFTDDGWGNSGTLHILLRDNKINVTVKDFVMSDSNVIGYGICGDFDFIKVDQSSATSPTDDTNLKEYSEDWTEEELLAEISKRSQYRDAGPYYWDYVKYMESVREVRDISLGCYPLYDTDTRYYQTSDFDNTPPLIIYLAKNEIYARHGYIFNNPDLNNFFLALPWYVPEVNAPDFDDSTFNEYEKANLLLLSNLDTLHK